MRSIQTKNLAKSVVRQKANSVPRDLALWLDQITPCHAALGQSVPFCTIDVYRPFRAEAEFRLYSRRDGYFLWKTQPMGASVMGAHPPSSNQGMFMPSSIRFSVRCSFTLVLNQLTENKQLPEFRNPLGSPLVSDRIQTTTAHVRESRYLHCVNYGWNRLLGTPLTKFYGCDSISAHNPTAPHTPTLAARLRISPCS